MRFEAGIAARPCQGETVCGDQCLALELESGLLIAVADGLGHGPHAFDASMAFVNHVRNNPDMTVNELMLTAQAPLAGTRGAAAALLRIDGVARRIEFAGVGNIHLHAISDVHISPVCAPGIVGHRVRKLLPFEFEWPREALFAMCSDGISSRLELERYAHLEPQQIADAILAEQGKEYDDATCVVVRLSGEA
jgi:negative regulator of sigma-B (phosphoserine phosphatase)